MTSTKALLLATAAIFLTVPTGQALAAQSAVAQQEQGKLIPVQQFTLDNGLKVIFHIDRSDPLVAVSLNAHVGSSRELPGRTGFAHMFEHLFFLDSENLGPGGLDAMSARIGGSGANGSTSRDMTDYLQTVPNDALEKMIWAEADKLGFFINTVTEAVLAKEKQVVKNEKRQGVDNQPYGHTGTVIAENLYPAGHPYSWAVIGSLADLDNATLQDVKDFYHRWYTPNNVTLVIAGDFDPVQARSLVEKYFAEIPRGAAAEPMKAQPVTLTSSKLLFHEDNFAQLPALTMVWPTVPAYHKDSHALSILAELLTDGKETPLHAVLVDEEKLTGNVSAYPYEGKVAGEWRLAVRAFEGVDLDRVKAAVDRGMARFEAQGIDTAALERAKTSQEVALYGELASVLGKGRVLARYDLYTGTPDYADRDIAALRAVGADDVMRVFREYVKDRPFLATSFVPKGKAELALANSVRAQVTEEVIVQGAEAEIDTSTQTGFAKTPSSFDRSVEPDYGEPPVLKLPQVWQASKPNGLKVSGIEDRELPMAEFELAIDGGRLMDDIRKPGASNLLARMLMRGTARRTPAELENALKSLGAEVNIYASDEHFVIAGQTLARNFAATLDLVEEMLLEPRWDPEELSLAKAATVSSIQSRRVQPNVIAERAFNLATYGENHILSRDPLGTETSVAALGMEDLQRYHAANLAPNIARFRVVGAVTQPEAQTALADLGSRWQRRNVTMPKYPSPKAPQKATVYFYDVPGAKQSVFAFGYPAMTRAAANYYPASTMNYILGGGGFASRLTQQLREGKGYTYGIRSGFSAGARTGSFQISSGVRSNVTLEAAQLVREIMKEYPSTFSAEDLEVTKSFLSKSRARSFETMNSKIRYLGAIGDYGLPADFPHREQAIVEGLTVEAVRDLARRYIRPDAMIYVIVGDAETQAARLKELGLGEPLMIKDALGRIDR